MCVLVVVVVDTVFSRGAGGWRGRLDTHTHAHTRSHSTVQVLVVVVLLFCTRGGYTYRIHCAH